MALSLSANTPPPAISVIVCTHNPRPDVLGETLAAFRAQTQALESWELLIIDNASSVPIDPALIEWHPHARVVRENTLGLTHARLRGLRESRSELILFADDDNLLDPDYLRHAMDLAAKAPHIGAWGGRITPRFEQAPSPWKKEFLPLLAIRDLGADPVILPPTSRGTSPHFTEAAPLGAGMVIRRAALQTYADALGTGEARRHRLDRRGTSLASGGDNDIVLTAQASGWALAYEPALRLTHIIPASRLGTHYLGRLLRGICRSWVTVQAIHGIPHPAPISRLRAQWGVCQAWFRCRAWLGGHAWVRWMGRAGTLEGRADISPQTHPE